MITVARDAAPTCMLTAAALSTADLSVVGLSVVGLIMWPATMIGRLGLRAALRCGVARVVAVGLRTTGAPVVSRRARRAVTIGRPVSAALRGMGHRPPCITIGRVALQA